MKVRYPLLLLGALWADAASAAIQLYGAVDGFVQYARHGSASQVRLLSGGASTSRWGMAGSEDIGGGTTVAFRLESGLDLMTGRFQNPGVPYNREANVAIGSALWGTIKLGKQYPALAPVLVDPFLGVGRLSPYASGLGAIHDLGPGATTVQARVANALTYETPVFNGFSGRLLYALRTAAGASPAAGNVGSVASYQQGPWSLNASYNAVWADTPRVAPDAAGGPRTDLYAASAIYDFGQVIGSFSYNLTRPRAAGTFAAQLYSLGASVARGPHVLRAGGVFRNVSGQPNHAWGMLLGYDYQFSRRTGIYSRVGGFRNFGRSALSFGSDPLSTPGVNPVVFALGLRQKF